MSDLVMTLMPGVMFDGTPMGSAFGDVVAQPYPLAYTGETVTAKFVSLSLLCICSCCTIRSEYILFLVMLPEYNIFPFRCFTCC